MVVVANSLQGTSIPRDASRKGLLFRTPLSQTSPRKIEDSPDITKGVQEYIETRFKEIDKARCQELTAVWGAMLKFPRASVFLTGLQMSDSYDQMRKSFRGKDRKKEFCEQMSDQLVFCEECGQRPILYNGMRDEDSMDHHLNYHERKRWWYLREKVEQMLLQELDADTFQLRRPEGFDPKNI